MTKIRAGKPGGKNANIEDLMREATKTESLLDKLLDKSNRKRWPVDLHPDLHKEIDRLQLVITGPNGERVNNRMLATEAILALLEKYERKSNGEEVETVYELEEGESFKRRI